MQNDASFALPARFSTPFIAVSDSSEKGVFNTVLGFKFKFDIQDHLVPVSKADL